MKKHIENNIKWSGKFNTENFSDILYSRLVVSESELLNCSFSNVTFKDCQLGSQTKFRNCFFENCKFLGKLTSLGPESTYYNCDFINCKFIGNESLSGSKFSNCQFSGEMKNVILRGGKISEYSKSSFFKCNLSNVIFNNVNIYGPSIFTKTELPKKGLLKLDNKNNCLISKANKICDDINDNSKLEAEILFKEKLVKDQNPIIFDHLFLEGFFTSKESREVFDEITKDSEII